MRIFCYVAHYGISKNHVCKDIALVKGNIPDHDLLVGGFPCQDYFVAKNAKKGSVGIEGPKGTLWWQIDEIIRKKRPSYILLENVDRLIRSPGKQQGRDFSIILRCLYQKGYAVEWRVINAADYGQAQRRRRTFVFGYHNDTTIFKSFAEDACICALKAFHQHITLNGIFSKAFPILSHSKSFVESWVDEAETIIGNCSCVLFLGGKERSTLKEISETLGKETIDLYNTSDTRGSQRSMGVNYQKLEKDVP